MEKQKKLDEYIEHFLSGSINGCTLEKQYSEIYDFDMAEIPSEREEYFQAVRDLLTHYSPFEEDRKKFKFYLSDEELMTKIKALQRST